MAEDDHGLSEIEDIATALDEIKQMAKMMKLSFRYYCYFIWYTYRRKFRLVLVCLVHDIRSYKPRDSINKCHNNVENLLHRIPPFCKKIVHTAVGN